MIIGHEQVLSLLNALVAENKLPSACLFVGVEGIGKMLAAKFVAQKMLCQQQTACGQCGKCQRVLLEQSEDVCFVKPEGDVIKIEQIRSAMDFLSLKALSTHRFVIIDGADQMTSQAANALLKSLEEPPMGSYFILLASQPARLLPTIRSRCQSFKFFPLSIEQVRMVLNSTQGNISGLEEWMIRASEGRSGKILRWVDRGGEQLREKAFAFVKLVLDPAWTGSFFSVSELVETREEAQDLMGLVLQILRDSYLNCFGLNDKLIHIDKKNSLSEFSGVGARVLLKLWQKAMALEQELLSPVDLKLSLENIYLESRPLHATTNYFLD